MNTKKRRGSFRTGGETIIAKACRTVPGFADAYTAKLRRWSFALVAKPES
jgi:hypothetical protein